ncbi:MAG: hypothetical protein D6784_00140 [Chloroflexi bacterium]|nr:MAG: hypothetical protein D6784_00140 [Chloroflexota bacterium]
MRNKIHLALATILLLLGACAGQPTSPPAVTPAVPTAPATATPAPSPIDTPPPATTAPTPTPEPAPGLPLPPDPHLRGAWLQASSLESQEAVDRAIDRLARGRFNAAFVNAVVYGEAYYSSDLLPPAEAVTAGFDPLAYFVEQAHRQGIAVHVWVVAGSMDGMDGGPAEVLTANPDWVLPDPDGNPSTWLDYSQPGVADFIAGIVSEVATRYPVDGVHLDYIRYPDWGWNRAEPANQARVEALNRVVSQTYRQLHQARPAARLSAAVFYNQGVADEVLQDWSTWLVKGTIDFVVPMAYVGEYETDWLEDIVTTWQADYPPEVQPRLVPGLAAAAFNFDIPEDDGVPKSAAAIQAELDLLSRYGYRRVVLFDLGLMSDPVLDDLAGSRFFNP